MEGRRRTSEPCGDLYANLRERMNRVRELETPEECVHTTRNTQNLFFPRRTPDVTGERWTHGYPLEGSPALSSLSGKVLDPSTSTWATNDPPVPRSRTLPVSGFPGPPSAIRGSPPDSLRWTVQTNDTGRGLDFLFSAVFPPLSPFFGSRLKPR